MNLYDGLIVSWRAYVTGEHPLDNGDRLLRPHWRWYAQALSALDPIPERLPPGLVWVRDAQGRTRWWPARGLAPPRGPSALPGA